MRLAQPVPARRVSRGGGAGGCAIRSGLVSTDLGCVPRELCRIDGCRGPHRRQVGGQSAGMFVRDMHARYLCARHRILPFMRRQQPRCAKAELSGPVSLEDGSFLRRMRAGARPARLPRRAGRGARGLTARHRTQALQHGDHDVDLAVRWGARGLGLAASAARQQVEAIRGCW